MKFCPNCGAAVEEGHKFCANCGEKLPQAEMPKEPVYTDDPALLNNPALQSTPAPVPPAQEEKVPELTLEPDLWGMPQAAKPAEAAAPAAASAAAAAAAAAAPAAAAVQAPSYAGVMEGVEYDNDYRREQEARRKREEARRLWEEEQRRREAQAAQNPRPDNVPSDYTMSQPQQEEPVYQLPNETLLLIWSIVLTAMFSLAGLIGLIKVVKARKEPSTARRSKLLSSAKIWLIVGTVLHVLPFLAELF